MSVLESKAETSHGLKLTLSPGLLQLLSLVWNLTVKGLLNIKRLT